MMTNEEAARMTAIAFVLTSLITETAKRMDSPRDFLAAVANGAARMMADTPGETGMPDDMLETIKAAHTAQIDSLMAGALKHLQS